MDAGQDCVGDFCRTSSHETSVRVQGPLLPRLHFYASLHPSRTSSLESPHFTPDLKEAPPTPLSHTHTLPLSLVFARRRLEVCAQLRGCNPRHDETSIVITELSGKPPPSPRLVAPRRAARNSPRRMQTAYRGDDDERR